jgi:NAD(P)-dependent dehydrogenase (short-subunit alcohol dehydrogenase family)
LAGRRDELSHENRPDFSASTPTSNCRASLQCEFRVELDTSPAERSNFGLIIAADDEVLEVVQSWQGLLRCVAAISRSQTIVAQLPSMPSRRWAGTTLLAYATTKGAIQNFTAELAQMLAEKGIRTNVIAPADLDAAHSLNHARRFGASRKCR